ncbi:minor tail protein [Gordonia phage SoilAssassin]|uniref:Minor tail protein n=1 Tax=Gordonia phage SoilAssassin TaxID=1821562 RepID=A0A142K8J7_9CAUD|nr:minor tail protein [Gordonia phage SoilAssassin]AMS02430.1 hypothetical protein SEA_SOILASSASSIN_29 [Gordonia phage SoilAssassin]
MVLPAPRFRTTRKWQANNVQPDNSLVVEGSSTTNVNLTVGAGAAVIVFVAGNQTAASRVDGVAMTLIGKTSNAAMYGITGLAAGARNVQVDRSGSSAHIVAVLSYTGVSTITGGALGSGSGNTPSGTPSGSGHLASSGSTSVSPPATSGRSCRTATCASSTGEPRQTLWPSPTRIPRRSRSPTPPAEATRVSGCGSAPDGVMVAQLSPPNWAIRIRFRWVYGVASLDPAKVS